MNNMSLIHNSYLHIYLYPFVSLGSAKSNNFIKRMMMEPLVSLMSPHYFSKHVKSDISTPRWT